jgi:predicted nucleic acid-binding protein
VTLIDTNLLLDLVTNDPIWAECSIRQMDIAAVKGPLAINGLVYAELSVEFEWIEELDEVLEDAAIAVMEIPRPALFLAGKACQRDRAAGGSRSGVFPDFFIGAHAAIAGLPLLARDIQRYRTDFPSLSLIAPQT